jgi:galactokinase
MAQDRREVPFVQKLAAIYHPDEIKDQADRWTNLHHSFKRVFGHQPDFITRSPGRVNIIGEHIDYSLFPVLPMAISADTIIAVSTREALKEGEFSVTIANYQDEQFPQESFTEPFDSNIPIDESTHAWTNYFKAGLRGSFELMRQNLDKNFRPRDMEVMVHGTVPPAGGLSSSAALVTASALAVLFGHRAKAVNKLELTQLAIKCERAVGVNSGG